MEEQMHQNGAAGPTSVNPPTIASRMQLRSRVTAFVMIIIYIGLVTTMLSMTVSGGYNGSTITWLFCGATTMVACLRILRAMQSTISAPAQAGRRVVSQQQWIRRMLARHPHMTRERVSLMLMDRDFDGNDYQLLLDLEQDNVPTFAGASESEIQRNPCFVVKDGRDQAGRSCSVCLHSYETGEEVRTIPCLHQFHKDCIDPWLREHATCPVCKFSTL